MAITFDGANKLILLDGAATVSIRGIYSRWIDWAATSDNLKWLPAFSTVGQPPTVPVYCTLLNGWLVRPLAGAYTLTLNDGFLYVDGGGEPITAVASGTEPRVRYENPVIAVGYSTASPQQADIDAILLRTDELHRIHGLKSGEPMTVTPTTRVAGTISQTISGDGTTTTTVTRA
jgi:hypothetical protein